MVGNTKGSLCTNGAMMLCIKDKYSLQEVRHTSPGKCGLFCLPTPNFSFDSFICSKLRRFHVLLKFVRGRGKYEYRHSKKNTKPNYKIQPHLALQRDIYLESAFYTKKLHCPLFLKWHLVNLMEAELGQLP